MVVYISEKAMAPHSSTLAWKISWTEEPGGLQSIAVSFERPAHARGDAATHRRPRREPGHERSEHCAHRVSRRAHHVREVLRKADLIDEPSRARQREERDEGP